MSNLTEPIQNSDEPKTWWSGYNKDTWDRICQIAEEMEAAILTEKARLNQLRNEGEEVSNEELEQLMLAQEECALWLTLQKEYCIAAPVGEFIESFKQCRLEGDDKEAEKYIRIVQGKLLATLGGVNKDRERDLYKGRDVAGGSNNGELTVFYATMSFLPDACIQFKERFAKEFVDHA